MKFVTVILLCFTLTTWMSVNCENPFMITKTSVTTTTLTTAALPLVNTTLSINTGICHETQDLYCEGTYLKSLCMVSSRLTYIQAKSICTEAGMNLFVVDNANVQIALQNAAGVRFLDRDYARLWVNGLKNPEGMWVTYNPRARPVFQQLEWLDGDSETGACLSILRHNKVYRMSFQGWDCSGIAWGYCEYINSNKVDRNYYK